MALIRVREKTTAEGAEPQILEVDESWLKRWPDDFEPVDEDSEPQQAASTEPPAPTAKNAASGSSDGEQAARSRF